MPLKAVILGSIGTLAETSELQRRAFNEAFTSLGIDAHWEREEYQAMLSISGGQARLAKMMGERFSQDDIVAIHREKTRLFQQRLAQRPDVIRPGLEPLVVQLRSAGVAVAIASTTFRASIDAIINCARTVTAEDFHLIVSREDVSRPKPDPQAYLIALERLNVTPDEVLAIEDTQVNLAAPLAAGIRTIAMPGELTAIQDFSGACLVGESYSELDLPRLQGLLSEPDQARGPGA